MSEDYNEDRRHNEDWVITFTIKRSNIHNVQCAIEDKFPKQVGYTPKEWVRKVVRNYIKEIVKDWVRKYIMESASLQAAAILKAAEDSVSVTDSITE